MIAKLDKIKLPSWVKFKYNYFVISDIHGRYKKFKKLLSIKPDNSKVILLGDFVDRGDQNLAVIKYLLNKDYILIKGNHDIALYYTLYPNKITELQENKLAHAITYKTDGLITLKELESVPKNTYATLYKKMKTFHLDGSLLFVHSGVYPNNIKESLNCKDGIAMCLYEDIYKYHPVWAGDAFGYPELTINNKKILIVHGHTPSSHIKECFNSTHICCDLYGKKMMGLFFDKNGSIQPYIC